MAKEYLVVFEGELVEGFDKETLLKNLDRAYKKGEDEIEKRLFADGPVEIIRTRKKKEAKFIFNGFKMSGAEVLLKVEKVDTLVQKVQPYFQAQVEAFRYKSKHEYFRRKQLRQPINKVQNFIVGCLCACINKIKSFRLREKFKSFVDRQKENHKYQPKHVKKRPLKTALLLILSALVGGACWYIIGVE